MSSIPANKPVLIVDEFGSESAKAAMLLSEKGIKDISILINGMDEWVDYVTETGSKPLVKWSSAIHYKLLSADEFDKMMRNKKEFVLIDTRPADAFTNNSKNYWENIGQLQGAINIPSSEINTSPQLPASKNAAIILYGFNSEDNIYDAARQLLKKGFTNISVLRSGIWNFRWSSHNIKGKENLNNWVVNVPEENL